MTQIHFRRWFWVPVVLGGLVLANCQPACGQQLVAYTDASLETMGPEGLIENGSMVVRDGKILAIGSDIEIPAGTRRVSLAGKTVMPAVVDPYFVFGRQARQSVPQTSGRRGRFRGFTQQRFSVGSFVKVRDFFYPYQTDFAPAARSGITVAHLVTDGRGQSAMARIDMLPGEDMLLEQPGFLYAKVTNQTSALDILRNGLKPDRGTRSRGARPSGRGESRQRTTSSGESREKSKTENEQQKPAADSSTALWTDVREGKKPLIVNVNNTATVAHVLKLTAGFEKVDLYLVATGPNLYQSIDELKQQNVTVILQPSIDQVPFTTERMNVPRMLEEKGIGFALSMSLNESQMRASQDDPFFPVSVLVKTGLPRKAALESLTVRPARMLGIDELYGTLEPGKSADFLIFDGDPLATEGRLTQIISQGRTIHED